MLDKQVEVLKQVEFYDFDGNLKTRIEFKVEQPDQQWYTYILILDK